MILSLIEILRRTKSEVHKKKKDFVLKLKYKLWSIFLKINYIASDKE